MIKKMIYNTLYKIKGASYYREYSEIKNIRDKDEVLKFQEKHLKELFLHAYKNVPYYHRIFKEINIITNEIVDLSKFNKIPILTRDLMRNNNELISNDYTTRKWHYNTSGGSTGEPIRFIQDDLYAKWGRATYYYYYKDILGIDEPSVKKVILWGSERDIFGGSIGLKAKIINWLTNQIFLESFKMSEKDIERYIKTINTFKPDLIRGYASSLYELCNYVERKNIIIHTPKILVSAAETLRDELREKIEAVFGTKVYDYYGSREVNNLTGECREGLMHVLAFSNHIEILDLNNQPVSDGEDGRVIVTNLHNYSMPLIRYEIGDMALQGSQKCICGNPLPIVKKIIGRISDYFIKENGTILPGIAFTFLFNLMDWVRAFQIIQEEYKRVRILIALEGEINMNDKKNVDKKIRLLMGQDCKIDWEFVDDIPKTPSGKYLYVRSFVRR